MLFYEQSRLWESLQKSLGLGLAGFKQGASAKQLVCLLLQGRLAQVALKAYSGGCF